MAPLLYMLSSRVIIDCSHFSLGMFNATIYNRVSEKTGSVATSSCLLGMLSAGFLALRCFLIGKVSGMETPHWVDFSMVFWTVSTLTQANKA